MRPATHTSNRGTLPFEVLAGGSCLGLALILAPTLFGSVTSEAQGVLGLILGFALILLSRGWLRSVSILPRWVWVILLGGIALSLLPLPLGILQFLSPAKASLARQFSLEPGDTWSVATLSPALTLRWSWQFSLLLVAFFLTRQLMRRDNGSAAWLWVALVMAVMVEVGAEWYFKGVSQKVVLGIWPVKWGNSGGTFANRNHFACWVMIACVFLCAVALRFLKPLHSARLEDQATPDRRKGIGFLLVTVVGLAMVFTLMSGSRSGLLALAFGGLMLAWSVRKHSSSRGRGVGLVMIGLLLVLIALPFAGHTLDRLSNTKSETSADYPKWRLWGDAVKTFLHYPLLGTGPGTFVRSNILLKSAGGESTAWHAENDVLQWLSEAGVWGLMVLIGAGIAFWRRLWLWYWRRSWRVHEPEMVIGAFAGLVAMLVHSMIDFPFQVMANAMLAAVLLGVIVGVKERGHEEVENRLITSRGTKALTLAGIVMIILGCLQIFSFLHYFKAKSPGVTAHEALTEMNGALVLWPLNTERANYWLRLKVAELSREPRKQAIEKARTLRQEFTRHIALDPYNWELRLERAWLDLAFSAGRQQSLAEARAATGLNPKQAQIPLKFAGALANSDPESAWEFLRMADVTQERLLYERLEIAWILKQDTSELWPLVPATDGGYQAMAEFGFRHKLPNLAKTALEKMRSKPGISLIARQFLQIKRPDLAMAFMPAQPNTNEERLTVARLELALGNGPRALGLAEAVLQQVKNKDAFQSSNTKGNISRETLQRLWTGGERGITIARQLAEAVVKDQVGDTDARLLQQLAQAYPQEARFWWLAYRARLNLNQFKEAAEMAINLAELVTAKP